MLLHTHLPTFDEVVGEPAGPDQMMWVIGAQQQFVRVTEIYETRKNEVNCKLMQTDVSLYSCVCYWSLIGSVYSAILP